MFDATHTLVRLGSIYSCSCGATSSKSYICEADGEVADRVYRCNDSLKVIDLP